MAEGDLDDANTAWSGSPFTADDPAGLPGFKLDQRIEGSNVTFGAPRIPGTFLDGKALAGDKDFDAGLEKESGFGLEEANEGLADGILGDLAGSLSGDPAAVPVEGDAGPFGQQESPGVLGVLPDGTAPLGAYQVPEDSALPFLDQSISESVGMALDRWSTKEDDDGVWSGHGPGILTHQDVLEQQADALAQGGQGWADRFMHSDIFFGYRDPTTDKIEYESEADAAFVAQRMMQQGAAPTGFGLEEGIWSEADVEGVESRGDVQGETAIERLLEHYA